MVLPRFQQNLGNSASELRAWRKTYSGPILAAEYLATGWIFGGIGPTYMDLQRSLKNLGNFAAAAAFQRNKLYLRTYRILGKVA